MKGFLTGLMGVLELHIGALDTRGVIDVSGSDRALLARSIAILAIYSQRLDAALGMETSIEAAASRIAGAAIGQLLPYTTPQSADQLQALLHQYQGQ
jgi:hypothetical protein